jgi:iron complex transport system ATP-binding protein
MSSLQLQQPIIEIGDKTVCRNLQLSFQPGQLWAILGRNGAGKTTLLHSLSGLHPLRDGQILLDDQPLSNCSRKHIARHMGLLLQHHEDPFPITVWQSVLNARYPHLGFWGSESASDHQQAQQAIKLLGLDTLSTRLTSELSGGERQRTAIAALLSQAPDIMLLDEPTSHLDLNHQIHVLRHFQNLAHNAQRTIIMSLHDLNLAYRFCSHVLLLNENAEVHFGERDLLLDATLRETTFGHPIACSEQQGRRVFWAE